MSRTMAIAALVLLGTAICCGAEGLPIGPAPEFGLAQIVEDGKIEITTVVSRPVWETRTREVPYVVKREVGGQTIEEERVKTVTYQVCKWVSEMRVSRRDAKGFRVFKDGTQLDAGAQAELLKKSAPVVLVSVPGFEQKLPAFYFQFFKAGTLVVYLQQESPGPAK